MYTINVSICLTQPFDKLAFRYYEMTSYLQNVDLPVMLSVSTTLMP